MPHHRALALFSALSMLILGHAADAWAGPKTRRAKVTSDEARRRSSDAIRAEAKPLKSESLGSPNDGHLENGVHLDTGHPYLHVIPAYGSGDLRWGMPELVGDIDRSAKLIAKRFPGSVLDIGDLSKKGGGDVLRHHSHESGRDADLGFYAVDGRGRQVHGHGFVKFERGTLESTNVPGARFDLARNWTLVESLTEDPRARVSHIFVFEPLKQALIGWAKTHHVSQRAIDRVELVMMQPHNSLPHDDHFHVRISCPSSSHGCVELARGALARKQQRLAQHGHPHPHAAVLRTPGHLAPVAKPVSHTAPQLSVSEPNDDDRDNDDEPRAGSDDPTSGSIE